MERRKDLIPKNHLLLSYGVAALIVPLVVGLTVFHKGMTAGEFWMDLSLRLPVVLWVLHFARRAAETAWLHRYSRENIPIRDALLVYLYYWGFALWISASVSSPGYQLPGMRVVQAGLMIFLVGEAGNFYSHLLLRQLRPEGSVRRAIPRGFLFDYVSCPHYLFEIVSWCGYALLTALPAAAAFALAGGVVLTIWARQRHENYTTTFDGKDGRHLYPPRRKVIFPFIY